MTVNVMTASKHWANRPEDERFATVDELHEAAVKKMNQSSETSLNVKDCRFEAIDDDGIILRRRGLPDATLNNYAFSQMCRQLGYPESAIVEKVNAPLAAQILNYRIDKTDAEDGEIQMLANVAPDDVTIRSVTKDTYSRFFDAQVTPFVKKLVEMGYVVPPARPAFPNQKGSRLATEEDVAKMGGRTNVRVGDVIAPAGLYCGDRDMFVILINPNSESDRGDGNTICKAVMITNSEVGARTLSVTELVIDRICGNHILWGVSNILEVSYRHIGEGPKRMESALKSMIERGTSPITKELGIIQAAKKLRIGENQQEVIDNIYGMRIDPTVITKKLLAGAINNAQQWREQDGDPYTLGGLTSAMTRYSQIATNNADERYKVDNASANIMRRFINKGLLVTN